MATAAPAGITDLLVISQAGCTVGDTIALDAGTPNEERPIMTALGNGPGSIVVGTPTVRAHPADAVVIRGAVDQPASNGPNDDDTDRPRKETVDERRQRARTNQGGKDDESIEGNVLETRCDQTWPSVVIANRDGQVEVRLVKGAQAACGSIQVGDYLEADGEKLHEGLFDADSVEISRNGSRLR